jgi:hypothetical protein
MEEPLSIIQSSTGYERFLAGILPSTHMAQIRCISKYQVMVRKKSSGPIVGQRCFNPTPRKEEKKLDGRATSHDIWVKIPSDSCFPRRKANSKLKKVSTPL